MFAVPALEGQLPVRVNTQSEEVCGAQVMEFPSKYFESRCFTVYTSTRHEKRGVKQMDGNEIHDFFQYWIAYFEFAPTHWLISELRSCTAQGQQ